MPYTSVADPAPDPTDPKRPDPIGSATLPYTYLGLFCTPNVHKVYLKVIYKLLFFLVGKLYNIIRFIILYF